MYIQCHSIKIKKKYTYSVYLKMSSKRSNIDKEKKQRQMISLLFFFLFIMKKKLVIYHVMACFYFDDLRFY
jgi:hypothetical protein